MDKLLEIFILEPEREFYVRELARKTKSSPTTISKYLNLYKKMGILKSEKRMNHLLFSASFSFLFRQKKLSYNLEKIYSSGVVKFLKDVFDYPEAIVLFGSWAKGENAGRSDLDLLIISPIKKEVDLKKFRRKLGNVQLFVFSNGEIRKMTKENPELVNSFLNGVVLDGAWGLFK